MSRKIAFSAKVTPFDTWNNGSFSIIDYIILDTAEIVWAQTLGCASKLDDSLVSMYKEVCAPTGDTDCLPSLFKS